MDHTIPSPHCKMNMLWNTDILDTCIVFRSWHIRTPTHFVLSLLAIVLLGVLFEYLRVLKGRLDVWLAEGLKEGGGGGGRGRDRSNSRAGTGRGSTSPNEGGSSSEELGLTPIPPTYRALRAAVYGSTVFLSFFLMLVFMTYNAYFIFATVFGATLGHYLFGSTINVDAILGGEGEGGSGGGDRGMACH
ncbi:copper transporter [Crepidotus variabilis]|uniref:Copper transport protein n=1 Tax=Crepidotus variabilis TaxID=179855 RepID=A0A9P6JK06_9AGAR|nr:copper transporter [Crepidotus variabilis]